MPKELIYETRKKGYLPVIAVAGDELRFAESMLEGCFSLSWDFSESGLAAIKQSDTIALDGRNNAYKGVPRIHR
jgi:hypothetical protein